MMLGRYEGAFKSNNSTVHFQAAKSSISKQIVQTQTVIAYLHQELCNVVSAPRMAGLINSQGPLIVLALIFF